MIQTQTTCNEYSSLENYDAPGVSKNTVENYVFISGSLKNTCGCKPTPSPAPCPTPAPSQK